MSFKKTLTSVGLLTVGLLVAACGDDDNGTGPMQNPDAGTDGGMDADTGPMLTAITISPATAALEVGGTQQLSVMGTFDDNTMAAVTMGITWSSNNEAVAVVGTTGVVTAAAVGTATITAMVDGLSDTVTVTVQDPTVELVVFDDEFGNDVQFNAFAATNFTIDMTDAQVGAASLRFEVPMAPPAGFVGGAISLINPQDLSGFNAVTFWAKASAARSVNVFGIGNDATNTEFQAEWNQVALTTDWQFFTIPLPDPALLTTQSGLLHFAEGPEDIDYNIFLDDIRYVVVDSGISAPQAAMATLTRDLPPGGMSSVDGTVVNYTVDGDPVNLTVRPVYFDYMSNDTNVATVDGNGAITAVMSGTATVTAMFDGNPVGGQVTVNVQIPPTPQTAAPTPTNLAADVISIFSDAYNDVPVSDFDPTFDRATTATIAVMGDEVFQVNYLGGNGNFAGILFEGANSLDLTGFTNVRVDMWAPSATQLRINLVDFGPDNAFQGGDDVNFELTFDATTTPAVANGTWVTFDIPLADFTGLTQQANLSQMFLSVDDPAQVVFYDNIIFYR